MLPGVPEAKRAFLGRLVERLRRVPGLTAIVLGGSYAAGTQHAGSDLDVGLYYAADRPFAIADIKHIAEQISAHGVPTVTGFYEWGPWVNGGAWIQTEAGKVDFIYRNLSQVEQTIDEAAQGIVRHDYDQQPTHGFFSVIYLAETQICLPLADDQSEIARLKRRVETYPPRLKASLLRDSLWSVEFILLFARSHAAAGDIYNTAGCLTRAASSLTQALFALNERYFLSDKRVMETIAAFPLGPAAYPERMAAILAEPGHAPAQLQQSVALLASLWSEMVGLAPGYEPRFRIAEAGKPPTATAGGAA